MNKKKSSGKVEDQAAEAAQIQNEIEQKALERKKSQEILSRGMRGPRKPFPNFTEQKQKYLDDAAKYQEEYLKAEDPETYVGQSVPTPMSDKKASLDKYKKEVLNPSSNNFFEAERIRSDRYGFMKNPAQLTDLDTRSNYEDDYLYRPEPFKKLRDSLNNPMNQKELDLVLPMPKGYKPKK